MWYFYIEKNFYVKCQVQKNKWIWYRKSGTLKFTAPTCNLKCTKNLISCCPYKVFLGKRIHFLVNRLYSVYPELHLKRKVIPRETTMANINDASFLRELFLLLFFLFWLNTPLNLNCLNKCFYLKIKLSVLGLLILQITHILKVSVAKITLETDFWMKDSCLSNFQKLNLKNNIKISL